MNNTPSNQPSTSGTAKLEGSRELRPRQEQNFLQLRTEQARCWKAGKHVLVETYIAEQPWLKTNQEAVLDLIYSEILLREEAGETPGLSEYVSRFPNYEESLKRQFELHDALGTEGEMNKAQVSLTSLESECNRTQTHIPEARHESGPPAENTWPQDPASVTPQQGFIGKYRIVERLGGGGQGDVFRAVHPTLGRDVAIKWAHQSVVGDAHARIIEEGKVLARLEHPGLVRVYDVDVHQGRPFVVFEYLAGQSLAEQMKRATFSPRAAARLIVQTARPLGYIHQQGILHRDIKPGNILIDAQGQPRLLDFGLAHQAQPWHGETPLESGVSGTLPYMAPEQARGDSDAVSPRTDQFSLAAVLYHLLTGRPPHQGGNQTAVWELARKGEVTPPRRVNPRVPRGLDRICMKALAVAPNQRYASVGEFARALRKFVHRPRFIGACLALSVLLLMVGLALAFRPSKPPASPAAGALSGELIVRIWSPDESKKGLVVGKDFGVLPTHNGEKVHLEARVNQPAYLYLLWLDSKGNVDPLYPWNRTFDKLPAVQELRSDLHSPPELDRGWPMVGPSGLDTALLLIRHTPLAAEVDLREVIGELPAAPLRNPQEVAIRGFDAGQPVNAIDVGAFRGLGQEAQKIDEPILQLMERLRPHFESIRAVRFAHEGE